MTNSQVIKKEEVEEPPPRLKSATMHGTKKKPSDYSPQYDPKYSQNRQRNSTQVASSVGPMDSMGMGMGMGMMGSMGGRSGVDLMHVPEVKK